MTILLKAGLTDQDVSLVITRSLEESFDNALVKPTAKQQELAKEVGTSLVDPFTEFIRYHIENVAKENFDTYINTLVEKFHAFLNTSKTALTRTQNDRLTCMITMFAILAPLRQVQRDAEFLQNIELIHTLNRLEIDLLSMMNGFPKK